MGTAVYIFNNQSKDIYLDKQLNEDKKEVLSMMLETEAGSGKYQETTRSSWPEDGYVFNETLSKCENGSSLSWDNAKKNVVMIGTNADKCYVYFDIKPPEFLADHIKSLYITQGENNLYLHDSTLENGANDGSYRYAGSSETTNNFVCFGYNSSDGTCPTDYLYRIIGVFDNQVKLIKYDYAKSSFLGTDGNYKNNVNYYENSKTYLGNNNLSEIGCYGYDSSSYIWSYSKLNTVNLNNNYLKYIGEQWNNKITVSDWENGGNTSSKIKSVPVSDAFYNEIISPKSSIVFNGKIALRYISEYGYAASPSAWTTKLSSYGSSSIASVNWMYMGLDEYSISAHREGEKSNVLSVGAINTLGSVTHYTVNGCCAVRPAFYLNSDVSYISGKGTKTEPYLIN